MPNFGNPKKKIEIGGSRYILLIDVAGRKDIAVDDSNKNIYCIDDDENVIWKVDAPVSRFERDTFVSLSKNGETIEANRFSGGEFIIDASSGKATMVGWHK